MQDSYFRIEELLGRDMTDHVGRARIAIFGIGAAGSAAAEALARCGVGSLTLVDPDRIRPEDVPFQITAASADAMTGRVQTAARRIKALDEDILVHTYETSFGLDSLDLFDFGSFDYIVDAMDSVPAKALLIRTAAARDIPLVSCMSLKGKTDARRLEITDLSRTSVCPMARELRAALRQKGVRSVKVLYSREKPPYTGDKKKLLPSRQVEWTAGCLPCISGAAGFMLASEVLRDLMKLRKKELDTKTNKGFRGKRR